MNVNITLDLDKLKAFLCPECQKILDNYIKQLAIEALKRDTKENKNAS
jgi:transcription initiation factor IIE alpha subunit